MFHRNLHRKILQASLLPWHQGKEKIIHPMILGIIFFWILEYCKLFQLSFKKKVYFPLQKYSSHCGPNLTILTNGITHGVRYYVHLINKDHVTLSIPSDRKPFQVKQQEYQGQKLWPTTSLTSAEV